MYGRRCNGENRGMDGEYNHHGMHGFDRDHAHHGMRGFGLKYLILNMASEGEVTGADIIAKVEERTNSRWAPSPGVIYPSLKKLYEDGYLDLSERDNKKYYKTTEKGKEIVKGTIFPWNNQDKNNIESILEKMDNYIQYILDNSGNLTEGQVAHIKTIYRELGNFKEISQ
jgi:DNA-binding PadR family transcriptional regulator